jgi:hypothetical protein
MEFVKAAYLHYLLDYFRETRFDIYNFDLIFEKFVQKKAITSISDEKGKRIDFKHILKELFLFIKNNKNEFLNDLRGFIT